MSYVTIPTDDTQDKLRSDVAAMLDRLKPEASPLTMSIMTVLTSIATIANDILTIS